ncbi:MAG TPA: hypothetical protein DF613_14775 [Lachnospiraceae bacterium]|nr:hypothetical protein [Lachnospiraceae bacterium]
MKTEVAGVKAEVAGMKEDIAGVKAEVADLKTDVRTVNLKLENEVNFKLRLLLENYMPAAKKYEMESEHVEILQSDMGTVKKAVEAHSGIINKHSEIIKEHGEQLAQLVKLA